MSAREGPVDTEALFGRAVALHRAGDFRAARAAYEATLAAGHREADTASNLSALLLQMGDAPSSERYGRLALHHSPNHANALNHLGLALKTLGRLADAREAFRKSVARDPRHADAWANLGETLMEGENIEEAVNAYERALAIEPELTMALVAYVHRKQQIADWGGLDQALPRLSRQIRRGEAGIDPFMLLFCCTDPGEILAACRNAARARERATVAIWGETLFPPRPPGPGRARVGYVSANFYDHAVGTLICQLLEAHDRERFEVFCYCHSPQKTGERRERIKRAADRFVEIDGLDDLAAARLIYEDRIDILVDLMGYTKGQRLRIFALRPAPVQVTWMGFAGSAGGKSMDYIIADKIVIPPGADRFYDEAVVRMPVCYQVNDAGRRLSEAHMTRAAFGISEDAMLYCCFNQIAKVTPPMVDLWAEILRAVPGSVMWLWRLYEAGVRNLTQAFQARGVAPDRLFFGATLPGPEHLTRYGLCDLFLDTFPYGGHATASNALFGGCPLLALPGQTFASRVSASLLTAIGLPQLIASSPTDYVAKAVALGRDPAVRRRLKQHLLAARTTSPLFDGARFARDLERAFTLMLARRAAGHPPAAIDIPPRS